MQSALSSPPTDLELLRLSFVVRQLIVSLFLDQFNAYVFVVVEVPVGREVQGSRIRK